MKHLFKGKSISNNIDVIGYYVFSRGKEYIYPIDGSARQECVNIRAMTGLLDINGVEICVRDKINLLNPKTKKLIYTSIVEEIQGAFQYTDINGYNSLLYQCNLLVEVQHE